MQSRLFRKIFIAFAVTLLIVLTLDVLFVALQTRQRLVGQIKEELWTNGRVMLHLPLGQIVRNIRLLSEATKARATVIGASGVVLADSEEDIRKMENHGSRPEIQEALVKGAGSAIRYSRTLDIDMFYVAFAISQGGEIAGYLRLARPLREVQTVIGHYYQIIYRAALIILTSFLLLALYFIPRFIAPILRMKDYTERVRGEKFPGSLMLHGDDEIGQLADNINLLVKKYEDNIRLAREEREKWESAFASMVEGIAILNHKNRIDYVNAGMLGILDDKFPEALGKTPLELFRSVELQDALERYRQTGQPVSQEISLGDGEPKALSVNIAPIKGVSGGAYKTIMVFHDVTRLRKLERVKADFVANVTHEIKTPLTAIIGFVETLLSGAAPDPPTAHRFLNIISEHALRLNRLVDDLLILSRIELGEAQVRPEPTPVAEALDKAFAVIESRAKEKGLAIVNNLPSGLPPILADPDSVVQILVNVLDNAVKFTPSGSITISTAQDKEGYLAVLIADTGVGIPRQDLPRLGERFYRVDKMRSREMGGTGLGLSIVKHLLKALQGWMEVESSPAAGTRVKLFFPLAS